MKKCSLEFSIDELQEIINGLLVKKSHYEQCLYIGYNNEPLPCDYYVSLNALEIALGKCTSVYSEMLEADNVR